MAFAFRTAWRFLVSSKGQTILIAVGIAIGVSVQVFIGSLISGLQKSLVDATIGRSAQVTVLPAQRGDLLSDTGAMVNHIRATESLVTALTPVAEGAGFLKKDDQTYPIVLRGFDLPAAEGIYRFKDALTEGTMPGDGEVLLGVDLAKEAGAAVGDTVTLLTATGGSKEVRISGLYDLKVASLNKSWLVSDLALPRTLFGYGEGTSRIEMQISKVFQADTVAGTLAAALGDSVKVENWKAQNASLLSGLSGQSISSLMIQVFVMISVVLAIASVLAISVLQKSKQLGILKAMGITDGSASAIFLFEGLLLGVFGAVLGIGLGLGLSAMFSTFAKKPDGTPVVALFLDPQFIAISGVVAVAAATLAALFPARRSSRLDPMEVIKNG